MVFQFAIALAVTPTQSIVPDQVTERQFGTVSGVMGMTYTLGIVLGTALSVALPRPWAYAAVIAVLLTTAMPFLSRDRQPLPWLARVPIARNLARRGVLNRQLHSQKPIPRAKTHDTCSRPARPPQPEGNRVGQGARDGAAGDAAPLQ